MSARPIWKGVLEVGALRIAVTLHGAAVPRGAQRAAREPERVGLEDADARFAEQAAAGVHLFLEEPEDPAPARPAEPRMRVNAAVPAALIDVRWFVRRYRLEADGDEEARADLSAALQDAGLYGIAEWSERGRARRACLVANGRGLELATLPVQAERSLLRASRRLRERLNGRTRLDRARELASVSASV